MRVGIIVLMQESNTFLDRPTTFERFAEHLLAEGEAVRDAFRDAPHEAGGFFAGLAEHGIDAVPLFAARALPLGPVTGEALDELMRRMFAQLDAAGPLDGLLVAPHGATIGATAPSLDGYWLAALRERVGPNVPIIGTLDPHTCLSPQMVESTNALIAYRTNPHLDQRQRGYDAARLMARTLSGEVRPTQAASYPPLIINIERQATEEEPLASYYEWADRAQEQPGVLANSLILGFPYADVPDMGTSTIVVTNNDPERAQRLADEMVAKLWERRAEWVGVLIPPAEAVRQATEGPFPVTLLDMGDNVGGGSAGDGTVLAAELLRRRVGPSLVVLADAEAQDAARSAGVGGRLSLRMGGKTDALHGEPLELAVEVLTLSGGVFRETGVTHGGFTDFDQGPTAVVRTADGLLTLVLTSRRMAPLSIQQVVSAGVDPHTFRVLVAKGVHAPVAAYGPVSRRRIRVDTPGATTADLSKLDFRQRRRPMYPFEPEMAR